MHCHSLYSDGTFTPLELLKMAEAKKFKLFSITDHDTLKGTIIAQELSKQFSFRYIVGVEISANLSGKKFEVLGYNFDPQSKVIIDALSYLRISRETRLFAILEKLNEVGIELTTQDVINQVEEGGSPGRPHVAKALIAKGYVKNVDEAFEKYLNPGKPGYVQKKALIPKEAISAIKKARGIAVLPHPLQFEFQDEKKFYDMLNQFLRWGIDGIEVYYDYSNHHPPLSKKLIEKRTEQLINFCQENGLIATVGSDFHGYRGEIGSVRVNEDVEEAILEFFK